MPTEAALGVGLAGVATLLVSDLMPTLVGLAFVGSLAIVMVVMRMETLTPVQFFWLVTILLGIVFVVAMMFYVKYS
jgi:hypothetical protein